MIPCLHIGTASLLLELHFAAMWLSHLLSDQPPICGRGVISSPSDVLSFGHTVNLSVG